MPFPATVVTWQQLFPPNKPSFNHRRWGPQKTQPAVREQAERSSPCRKEPDVLTALVEKVFGGAAEKVGGRQQI